MATEVRLIGAEAFVKTIRALGDASPRFAGIALFREAERIMTKAKALTPVLTGALRASGQVVPPEMHGDRVRVTMGFGNSAVGYAVHVHENLQARHPVGQAKFLEQPFNEAMSDMDDRLALVIRDEIARAARQ